MKVGQILRDPYAKVPYEPIVDGYPNLYFETAFSGASLIPFVRGINPMRSVDAFGKRRRPAVIIRSSPHKAGSKVTPWQDRLDPDRGHVRYFGDNKASLSPGAAHLSLGNAELLRLLHIHNAPDRNTRVGAPPLVFFETTPIQGRQKGYVKFQGFGLLTDAELVTQVEPHSKSPFANYVFDCVVLSLAPEAEQFDWGWINARRDPHRSDEQCLIQAPAAWKDWVDHGLEVLPRIRRRVASLLTTPASEQRPFRGSREERILWEVYDFYSKSKARFEGLAEIVAERVLRASSKGYRPGWITRASGDRGIDFVARLDVGQGFSSTSVVVLGQAKCESPDRPTGGVHIARTVARLRRGWIGVYVTTSFFSTAVQEEVLEDRYPIVLVPGLRVAQEVDAILIERKIPSARLLLEEIDSLYASRVDFREPEEVLFTV